MAVLALALWGCGDSPTLPTADQVEIVSAVPQAGSTLAAGERVAFTLRARFSVATYDNAEATMIFVAQSETSLQTLSSDTRPRVALSRGTTTTVTLSDSITIPASARNLTILVLLAVNDRQTGVDQEIVYTVR